MRDPGEEWVLRDHAGLALGTIVATEYDVPWANGTWKPTAAFHPHETMFADEAQCAERTLYDDSAEAVAAADRAYERVRAAVQLYYPGGEPVPEFLLHIDDGTASFRWNDEPFDSDDDRPTPPDGSPN